MQNLYTKPVIFLLIVVFLLWILLQLAIDVNPITNPFNYFLVIIIFFFIIRYFKASRSNNS
ncbi:hypothetical protein [Paenibacillus sp. Z6-24]